MKNFCFKKKVVKSGETKTLSYQLSQTKRKWWYTYSMKYFMVSVFLKNLEHETKDYLDRALEKAKKIVMTFEDPTM